MALVIGIFIVWLLIELARDWLYNLFHKSSSRIVYNRDPTLDRKIREAQRWESVRQEALYRARLKCQNCGSKYSLEVHHIVPRSEGGGDNLSNLRVLCHTCHKAQHPYDIDKIVPREPDTLAYLGYKSRRPPKRMDSKRNAIEVAIRAQTELRFTYTKANGEVTQRRVIPNEVFINEYNHRCMRGYDLGRKADRVFRTSSMTNLR